uniref:MFS transporter n=1 Tax=Stappia sp. TaxID=1870903 RepID=UPI003BA8D775
MGGHTHAPDARQRERDMRVIVIAGGLVLAISFGVRAVFGGVIEPLSAELFGGRIEIFSLAIAIQNLVWGLAQPGFGMIADRFGDRKAMWIGLACYAAGMAICVTGSSAASQGIGAGVLVGMGISGTAFGTVLAVVGRSAPVEKRSHYLGIASAIGSSGQVVLPLLVSWLITFMDWRMTLAIVSLALVPMVFAIPLLRAREAAPAAPGVQAAEVEPGLGLTIRAAFGHGSYLLLAAGFFVCGFHLAFITAHLPTFVQMNCISTASAAELRGLGLQALAVAGLANIFGTIAASRLGMRFSKPYVLAAIYALRAVAILVFISLPITPASVLVFGAVMGVLWLSTVPLTSALVLVMFGPRAMGTLFGFVFLSHQLGSFAGVWLGGLAFDRTGSYDQIWYLAIAMGALSAIAHLLVRECAAPRPGGSTGPTGVART